MNSSNYTFYFIQCQSKRLLSHLTPASSEYLLLKQHISPYSFMGLWTSPPRHFPNTKQSPPDIPPMPKIFLWRGVSRVGENDVLQSILCLFLIHNIFGTINVCTIILNQVFHNIVFNMHYLSLKWQYLHPIYNSP